MPLESNTYSLCLDIGTTNVKCAICDPRKQNEIKAIVYDKLRLIYLPKGAVEIDPQQLWTQILHLIQRCLSTSNITIDQVSALGIASQRNTFVTWDKTTGEEFHNLIVWKDLRAKHLVDAYNNSWKLWGLNFGSKLLYYITKRRRFLVGSIMKFMNAQVSLRLVWVLTKNQTVRDNLARRNVLFGTLDTWLIYKLTKGTHHVTDVSCASSTGLFDPFTLSWAPWVHFMFSIPAHILPKVLPTCCTKGEFGIVDAIHLGHEIPIRVSVADQSASMFGVSCLNKGDLKVTLGTGTWMGINTWNKAHTSVGTLYPVVGWQLSPKSSSVVYICEGSSYATGTLIEWCKSKGLFRNVEETSTLASSVASSDGFVFPLGFSALHGALMDEKHEIMEFLHSSELNAFKARRDYYVRALLESIAFRVKQIFDTMVSETEFEFSCISVDGGSAQNDFLCQLIADLTQVRVWRPRLTECSIVGVAKLITFGEANLSNDGTEFLPRLELYQEHMSLYKLWSLEVSWALLIERLES
uniref:Glycerol kinase 5 n=2 Tax=Cacopsylla melanoneura TaxID=428564 RepID=A0A8D9DUZ3_9HEMI